MPSRRTASWAPLGPAAEHGAPLSREAARSLALEVFVAGYTGVGLPDDYAQLLADGLAGAILFKRNLVFGADGGHDLESLTAHTAAIHAAGARHGELPVICSVDQEGGPVQRLRAPFTVFPPMRDLGERGDVDLVRRVGWQLGRECLAAGFNVDYAPVLDVDTNPANPVIGRRSFSRDPHEVARLAGALLDGLQAAGVAGCGKHFPGHGYVRADSHHEIPVDTRSLKTILADDAAPYGWLSASLMSVMPAHVIYPKVDKRPAGFSEKWLKDILRARLRYDGAIFSDDLSMAGARLIDGREVSYTEAAVAALSAGCDMVLLCNQSVDGGQAVDELLDGHWLFLCAHLPCAWLA